MLIHCQQGVSRSVLGAPGSGGFSLVGAVRGSGGEGGDSGLAGLGGFLGTGGEEVFGHLRRDPTIH